jgi:MFS family permease
MERISKHLAGPILDGVHFLAKQHNDWKITAARTSIDRFLLQMVLPYLSIYTIALGATGTQLGIVNSIGMGVAGLLGPFTGCIIDQFGTKRIYLIGIIFLATSHAIYGVAQSWPIIIPALLTYWLGWTTAMHSCSVICGNSLATEERATAMSCCETLAAGLLGMIGPIVGAFLVTIFGGIHVNGIRPLFLISLIITLATFLFVQTQLSNRRWGSSAATKPNFFRDLSQVFRQGRSLKRFVIISSITFLPQGMVIPFAQLFAKEVKGADQYILGGMVTGFALTPFLLGIPFGRLADRIGRKKVLCIGAPLFWASNLILIWSPSSLFLIISGILQGFYHINLVLTNTMSFEVVPHEQMGRWIGVVRFFRMLLAAGSAFLAGILWDHLGPQYLFLVVIGLDAFIRIPLIVGMPETLKLKG